MLDVWILELLKGAGRAFTQPFLYIAIIMIWISSRNRIKREREQFGTRVFPAFSEMKGTWGVALSAGLVLSIFSVAGGLVVTYPLLLLIGLIFILVSLPLRFSWYSAAYTLGLTYIVVLMLPYLPDRFKANPWVDVIEQTPLTSIAILLSVLLVVEAFLLLKTSPDETFPERKKGRRGMWIGQHRSKKMAVVPFIALMPVGGITPFADWWPVLSIGGESFGLIVVPLLTGFEWIARAQPPEKAAKTIGRHVFVLGFFVLIVSIASYFISILSLVAVAISLLGREWINIRHRLREDQPPFFTPQPKGIRILGVIPGSPASQMGLIPGELVERVNNMPVRTENQFYEALQVNGAFNKLEVRDEWGENRYVQRAMYEGEHYELGLVFVEPPPKHESSVGFF
ncbi:PDZ domain-containing protein [Halobacillus locisalis]|uniref:PDZ domain-containing protein n=1 Tax=Halobacillus locisalis TaxID=220753 RepID=UPI001FE838C5|nr:PDZ domain-containing protein [Halobacillus locisalis]